MSIIINIIGKDSFLMAFSGFPVINSILLLDLLVSFVIFFNLQKNFLFFGPPNTCVQACKKSLIFYGCEALRISDSGAQNGVLQALLRKHSKSEQSKIHRIFVTSKLKILTDFESSENLNL